MADFLQNLIEPADDLLRAAPTMRIASHPVSGPIGWHPAASRRMAELGDQFTNHLATGLDCHYVWTQEVSDAVSDWWLVDETPTADELRGPRE
jgi:hypothetical protein